MKRTSSDLSKMLLKLTCLITFLPLFGFAQGQERKIDKLSWRDEPIRILSQKTKGKTIEFGKKFLEEDDWLRGLTVTARNVSDKPISRIELSLAFPRPEGTSEDIPTYTVGMFYGRDPSDADAKSHKQILPGENVEVKLLEVNLPFIRADLESLGYPEKVTHAQILVSSVTFNDGTEWVGGDILYPDPANPKQKINPKFPMTEEI